MMSNHNIKKINQGNMIVFSHKKDNLDNKVIIHNLQIQGIIKILVTNQTVFLAKVNLI